ncbi:MAG: peptidoglycan editing factor PgeF [Lachnospiraceae bacterium]|nr:peptidoglycan editing factor PgeF [Lachnospiraceae bacterium]
MNMYQLERAFRRSGAVLRQNQCGEIEYLTFPLLEETGCVEHLFSTRLGGVSKGEFASMNLSFQRGDAPECVLENYRRIASILKVSLEDMVTSKQTHTTNIKLITKEDKGKGVIKPLDYDDIDGLITQEEGIVLVTSYADCVPLYFVDPIKRAIGLAHSGWRGTVQQMGACMVRAMEEQFGSKPEDIRAAIGPSICQDCYEVSEDVAQAFRESLAGMEDIVQEICDSGCYKDTKPFCKVLEDGREPGKYQLDLWLANLIILRKAGIPLKQIAVTDICTCHNPDYLFSHRASKGKRGALEAFLMLRES